MKVKVEIIGALLKTRGERRLVCELPAGSSIADLLAELAYAPMHRPHIVAAINGEICRHDTPLDEGAQVILSTLVGGG